MCPDCYDYEGAPKLWQRFLTYLPRHMARVTGIRVKDCRRLVRHMEAGMAKLFASEIAMQVALDAVRIHGGYGYSTEFDVEPGVPAEELNITAGVITYQELTFAENNDAMIRTGVPEQIAEMNVQAFSLTADGDAGWVTDNVPSVLGRPARSFAQFAADHATAFS